MPLRVLCVDRPWRSLAPPAQAPESLSSQPHTSWGCYPEEMHRDQAGKSRRAQGQDPHTDVTTSGRQVP